MEWIVTTARTVDEAQTRALDLLGVDLDDAEVQVVEEGKTGLFGRTKSEARVRARIKPKAPPVKEERRGGRNDNRNRNRNRNNRGGGEGQGRNRGQGNSKSGSGNSGGNKSRGGNSGGGKSNSGKSGGRQRGSGNTAAAAVAGGAASSGGSNNEGGRSRRNRGGGDGRQRDRNENRGAAEDRVEMPIDEQRTALQEFVTGVAIAFDPGADVELTDEDGTLTAQVSGGDGESLGRLIGAKASTLQTLEELARTAMHRAADGRRYHRIRVDVDGYRARRREALVRFATDVAESVAASGEAKGLEPMAAADRKLVHDAISNISGVETVSEGRDPRRYIVVQPTDGGFDEEE